MISIRDRYGDVGEMIYENALAKLLHGKATIEQALDYIMEFARGQWTLVVDENLEGLANELATLNNAVRTPPKGLSDEDIRRRYGDRGVFITSNDRDFQLHEVPATFEDGMILVPNGVAPVRLARAVERLLMNWRKSNGAAPVRVRLERSSI